jgi:hypothetical protein
MVSTGKLHPESLVGDRISLDQAIDSMTNFQTIGFTMITGFS